MSNPTHAIILLAGFGGRLKPLTDKTHKAMLPIGQTTILQHQLNQLKDCGVTEVHLCLGHLATAVQKHVQNQIAITGMQFHFHHNPKYLITNNAFSLLRVLADLKPANIVLIDGDLMMDTEILKTVLQNKELSTIICDDDKSKLDDEAMKVLINDTGAVQLLSKTVSIADSVGEAIGLSYFDANWVSCLREHIHEAMAKESNWNKYYEDMVNEIIANTTAPSPLSVASTQGKRWVEVDDHNDLKRARNIFG